MMGDGADDLGWGKDGRYGKSSYNERLEMKTIFLSERRVHDGGYWAWGHFIITLLVVLYRDYRPETSPHGRVELDSWQNWAKLR